MGSRVGLPARAKQFSILSSWRVRGTVEEVYDILSRPEEFTRWWSSVYLEVKELKAGDADGVGRIVRLHTRGKLPYTLSWEAQAVEVNKPHRIVVAARGDLEGTGEWQLKQSGEWVEISYSWTVFVNKPWMQYLLVLLKPVFVANHRWAMQKGEEGLKREMAKRT